PLACVGSAFHLSRSRIVDAEALAAMRGGDETVCAMHITISGHSGCRTCDSAGQHCYIEWNSGGPAYVCYNIWRQCTPAPSNDICLTHETYLYRCNLDATDCLIFPPGTATVFQDQFCSDEVKGLEEDCPSGSY